MTQEYLEDRGLMNAQCTACGSYILASGECPYEDEHVRSPELDLLNPWGAAPQSDSREECQWCDNPAQRTYHEEGIPYPACFDCSSWEAIQARRAQRPEWADA